MSSDPGNLIAKVYDLLSGVYAAAANDQAFLAFETLGLPISDGMFKLNPTDPMLSPALAVERLSELANKVPLVRGGSINWSMATVDGIVNLLLEASMPAGADAMPVLGAMKQQVHAKFDSTLGSMSGVPGDRFHPVYASPADWYIASVGANWTLHTVGQDPSPAPPQRRVPIDPPVWRVLPAQAQPALSHPIALNHPLMLAPQPVPEPAPRAPAPQASAPNLMRFRFAVRPQAAAPAAIPRWNAATMAIASATQPATQPSARPPIMVEPLRLAEATQQLQSSTTSQPITTQNIAITFEHCIVTLQRPWWPDGMLMLRNWFLPGYARGDIATGSGGSGAGLMPVITTGFVAIRNLRIVAPWSAQDQAAVQASASFGPFSLLGRSFDSGTGTLSCPGMQIIGWFCAALPTLPPLADPALPAASAPPPTAPDAVNSPASSNASGTGGPTVPQPAA